MTDDPAGSGTPPEEPPDGAAPEEHRPEERRAEERRAEERRAEERVPVEPSPDGLGEPVPATAAAGPSAWRQLGQAMVRPRLTAANLIIALLIGVLGFALIAQVKANTTTSSLQNDRPDDLVRILSDLDSRKDRLDAEITSLEATQRQLTSGGSSQAAQQAAKQRADELGILAGTLAAQGPGLTVQLQPAQGTTTHAIVVLNAVEELRGAGAEAIEIAGPSGPTVRVVAATWFTDAPGGLSVSGTVLAGTLTITVIGDPQTMQTALTIPGGVDDAVAQDGGSVKVSQPGTVRITALAPQPQMAYAKPTS